MSVFFLLNNILRLRDYSSNCFHNLDCGSLCLCFKEVYIEGQGLVCLFGPAKQ
ncbi:hypothetical protein M758_UG044800 [Ceratodon purpureus]|nr:hypothetical protein M758_UG044800 [Ceratodon purpureus]